MKESAAHEYGSLVEAGHLDDIKLAASKMLGAERRGRRGHHLADPDQWHDQFLAPKDACFSSGSTVLSPSTRPRLGATRLPRS